MTIRMFILVIAAAISEYWITAFAGDDIRRRGAPVLNAS
jgi:hypothetical protein